MNSNSKATSRQSKNSRIQAGQTSLVPAAAKAVEANGKQEASRFDSIVERLRASQLEHDVHLETRGRADGRLWAERKATVPELRRLAQARDPWHDWYFGVGSSAYSDAERFCFIIRPTFDGDREVAAEFWEVEVTGDRELLETAYVQTFAEAAMDIWEEFKYQL